MARVATKVSSLVGKLETEVHIKASAEEFYHVFAGRPDLVVPDASLSIIQGIDLLDGEWGTVGSVSLWNYVQDGKAQVQKDMIEVVEPEKNLVTYRVLEGDLMEDFKKFAITIQVTPKSKGLGSIVRWHLDYEKISEEVAPPESFLKLGVVVLKGVDKHLFFRALEESTPCVSYYACICVIEAGRSSNVQ